MSKTLWSLALVVLAGCSSSVNAPPAPPAGTGAFRIESERSEYVQSGGATLYVQATVTNTSAGQDFYSNVGDGFDAALEQSILFAANGTQAVLERRGLMGWVSAPYGQMIEGSRFVILRAGGAYRLDAFVAPSSPGVYRIRLDYVTRLDDPAETPSSDYSNTFVVR